MFRVSGGLLYHWRAFRHRSRWSAFRAQLAAWLDGWRPATDELILIGPSGGHTLPTQWLRTFATIHAYDLDPLAAPIFRWRHHGTRAHFRREDAFWRGGKLAIDALDEILARHPRAAVLFTNVIGQVLLEGRATEEQWYAYLSLLRSRLDAREWASYHDLFTHEGNQVIDHLTTGPWTARLAKQRLEWALTARSRHEIEAVRPAPRA